MTPYFSFFALYLVLFHGRNVLDVHKPKIVVALKELEWVDVFSVILYQYLLRINAVLR